MKRASLSEYLSKLKIIVDKPGAFAAWRAGCHLTMYGMICDLPRMGIRPKTVIDVGASRGMFSRCARRIFPDAAIYAFEPLTDCYEDLLDLKRELGNFVPWNVALGERRRSAIIYRSDYEYSSSLLKMGKVHKRAFPYSSLSRKERIQVETLDSIFTRTKLAKPILLKLDVQGYEKSVVRGGLKITRQCDFMICELSFKSLYEGQSLFEEMYDLFVNLGFQFHGPLNELRDPESSEVLQIDALFRKHSRP